MTRKSNEKKVAGYIVFPSSSRTIPSLITLLLFLASSGMKVVWSWLVLSRARFFPIPVRSFILFPPLFPLLVATTLAYPASFSTHTGPRSANTCPEPLQHRQEFCTHVWPHRDPSSQLVPGPWTHYFARWSLCFGPAYWTVGEIIRPTDLCARHAAPKQTRILTFQ